MEVEKHCDTQNYKCVHVENSLEQLFPSVRSALKDIVRKEGYSTYEIRVTLQKSDGGNYMANLYEVNVTGRTADGYKETNIFLKQSLENGGFRDVVNLNNLYLKEVFYYTEMHPLYQKLQQDAGIPTDQMFKSVKCYSESNVNAVIMENLNKKGYKLLNRTQNMPMKFVELAVEQLAKFHALSFLVQLKMPDYFERKVKPLNYPLNFNANFKHFFLSNILSSVTEKLEEETKKKMRENGLKIFHKYSTFYTDQLSSVNCLCHGDYRITNILMKENEGEVTEVIPIDYQTMFYGSPVTDLFYHIYNGSDGKYRREHEDHIKNFYFDTLKDFLLNFDVDVEEVYPRKIYDDDYRKVREFGFFVGIFVLPLAFTKEDEVPSFEGHDLIDVKLNITDDYYKLMKDICDEFPHLVNLTE